jgi:hypothetical protein
MKPQAYRYKSSAASLIAVPIHCANEAKGRILEDCAEEALKNINIPYERNVINGIGPDYWVGDYILTECKNFATTWRITPSIYEDSIKSRWLNADPEHEKKWLLIISKLICAEEVLTRIAEDKVFMVELGFQVADNRHSRRNAQKIIEKKMRHLLRLFTSYEVTQHADAVKQHVDAVKQHADVVEKHVVEADASVDCAVVEDVVCEFEVDLDSPRCSPIVRERIAPWLYELQPRQTAASSYCFKKSSSPRLIASA